MKRITKIKQETPASKLNKNIIVSLPVGLKEEVDVFIAKFIRKHQIRIMKMDFYTVAFYLAMGCPKEISLTEVQWKMVHIIKGN